MGILDWVESTAKTVQDSLEIAWDTTRDSVTFAWEATRDSVQRAATGSVTIKNSTEIWIRYDITQITPIASDYVKPGDSTKVPIMTLLPVTVAVSPWKGDNVYAWWDPIREALVSAGRGMESTETAGATDHIYDRTDDNLKRLVIHGPNKERRHMGNVDIAKKNEKSKMGVLPSDHSTFEVAGGWAPDHPDREMGYNHPA